MMWLLYLIPAVLLAAAGAVITWCAAGDWFTALTALDDGEEHR
ncbi:hypothetical protein [Actinomadura miaoliensis]|uniref:Cbb3-type cytochrome oxidase assembly protein CcoS n=1 Tax=Actinomadura miaoliensis TaxID=430685 RepID=A0ABP7V4X9_9ACTN